MNEQKKTTSKANKPKRPTLVKKPALARQTKPMKEKSTKPPPSTKASKGKVLKVQKGKSSLQLVDVPDKETQPTPEPQIEDDEYNLQKGVTQSLPIVEGKGKGIATDEQVAQSLLELQQLKGKKKSEDVSNTVALEERTAELNEGQAGSDPGNTLESRPQPDEDQAISNPRPSHVALAGPNPEPMHEDFIATNPPSSFGTLSSMKNLDDDFNYGDQFLYDKPTKDEPGKANMETEVESMVTIPIHQASLTVPPLSIPVIDLT
ncbi:hypothetical protein Tco_1037674 [Tanacetum coccineum]